MKCRRSRNTYMRMVTIHRGIEKLCKNRNKLIDKHTIMFLHLYRLRKYRSMCLTILKKDTVWIRKNWLWTLMVERRKDQMKMLLNQYEKIRRIYTEKDYIGSRTEALVSHECSSSLSSRPKAFSRKKIKRRAMYHTFFIVSKIYRIIISLFT